MSARIGAVVIGRNEGERLMRCLESLRERADPLIYVDSGSHDGSPRRARDRGAVVVELDASRPFTAARGRNEGLACLRRIAPDRRYVQFVDGDCEVRGGWLEAGRAALDGAPDVAAVAGRLRERDRSGSIYRRLCDLEWDRPSGESEAVGGNAMFRIDAFEEAGGFDATLPAGEEPELCRRLRARGWRIRRLEHEMMWHDADLGGFGDWWRRSARSGRALVWALERPSADAATRRRLGSMLFFGLGVPAATLATALAAPTLALVPASLWPVQWVRIAHGERRGGRSGGDAAIVASFTLLGKVAGSAGALAALAARRRGASSRGPRDAGAGGAQAP
jgi:GT2 family glycosyltransferase